MTRLDFSSAFLIVLLFSVLTACGESEPEGAQAAVEVKDFKYVQMPAGERLLTGKLYNTTAVQIENAQIQVSLFDENNRRISSMVIRVQDVEPGSFKPFRERMEGKPEVRGAKVRSVLVM